MLDIDIEPIHSTPYYIATDGQLRYVKEGDLLNPIRIVKPIKGDKTHPPSYTIYPFYRKKPYRVPISRLVAGYFSEYLSYKLWLLVRGLRKPWLFTNKFRIYRKNKKSGFNIENLKVVEK